MEETKIGILGKGLSMMQGSVVDSVDQDQAAENMSDKEIFFPKKCL